VPDRRRHRGARPGDRESFGEDRLPVLRRATEELSWLLSRGYATPAALRLVGDHHQLTARQRLAVQRCACSDAELEARRARVVEPQQLAGATVWIDGFNVLTTVEAALAGGPLLIARDGALRDLASMHGSYRRVEETRPALAAIAETLDRCGVARARWLFDAPVSNSGRLAELVREVARARGAAWTVELVGDPDPMLVAAGDAVVASADSGVLSGAKRCWPLAREVVERLAEPCWLVDLERDHEAEAAGCRGPTTLGTTTPRRTSDS